jgi:flagellar assembly protein FliH
MSTSYSPAPDAGSTDTPVAEPFRYNEIDAALGTHADQGRRAAMQAQALVKREEEAREAGRKEGEDRVRALCDRQLERARESVQLALEAFAAERAAYFRQVEAEVVQLALSIARKILHREAQVDPLLLAGVVRVALDQIEAKTTIKLRIHPLQSADCRSFLSHHMDPERMPEIIEDPAIEMDRCVLQTELGTAELGIEDQLKEIEQGLLDLMARKPRQQAPA